MGRTIRRRMIDLLEEETLGARDISQMLGIKEKEVYSHLPHVARSVSARKRKLAVAPSECLACGFSFEARKRFSRPSRCPKCRGERISEPVYRVE